MSLEFEVRLVLADCLGIDPSTITRASSPENVAEWTSLAHLRLAVAIETRFGIEFTTDEILEITSAGRIVETLSRRLAVAQR